MQSFAVHSENDYYLEEARSTSVASLLDVHIWYTPEEQQVPCQLLLLKEVLSDLVDSWSII